MHNFDLRWRRKRGNSLFGHQPKIVNILTIISVSLFGYNFIFLYTMVLQKPFKGKFNVK